MSVLCLAGDVRAGAAEPLRGQQARLLLAYLALNRHRWLDRDELAAAVWGMQFPQAWQASLRMVISRVRAYLRTEPMDVPDPIVHSASGYRLAALPGLVVDVEQAHRTLAQARRHQLDGDWPAAAEQAARVVAVLESPLVPGGRADWLDQERRRAALALTQALEIATQAALRCGQQDEACAFATRLVDVDPYRESAYALLMQAHACGGNRVEALAVYDRCRRLFARELGADPSAELETLYLQLLARDQPVSLVSSPVVEQPKPGYRSAELEFYQRRRESDAFVGRQKGIDQLLTAFDRAQSDRVVALVEGEPGAGKTRLLAHLATGWHLGGAHVFYSRAEDVPGPPYPLARRLFLDWLLALPQWRLAELLAPFAHDVARVWPEVAARLGWGPPPRAEQQVMYQIFELVTHVLRTVAAENPTVLIIDDAQWLPENGRRVLRHILRRTAGTRLLLIFAFRNDQQSRAGLGGVLSQVYAEEQPVHLSLAGLDVSAVAQLVGSQLPELPPSVSGRLATQLHEWTGGNPYFLLETLRLAAADCQVRQQLLTGQAGRQPVPVGVQTLVQDRLCRLRRPVRRLLADAAALGPSFETPELAAVTGISLAGCRRTLREAEHAGLLHALDGEATAFGFSNRVVHDAIYHTNPAHRRRPAS